MELLNALGLNVKILIAQLFNFSILLFILWKFAYKPILSFLDERKDKIEKGITDAEKATAKLIEMEEKEKEVLKKAKIEAVKIMEEAKERAEKRYNETINKAKEDIGKIIDQEKEKMRAEKGETLKSIKKEVASLVVLSVEKVLEEKMDDKKDQSLIKKIVKEIK